MARTGRPPIAPLLGLTPTQERFYDWAVAELLGGNLRNVPEDKRGAFRAGVALGRQYPKWNESRRKS
jgi:hypothetical protein